MLAGEVKAAGTKGEEFRVLGRGGGDDRGEARLEFGICGERVKFKLTVDGRRRGRGEFLGGLSAHLDFIMFFNGQV